MTRFLSATLATFLIFVAVRLLHADQAAPSEQQSDTSAETTGSSSTASTKAVPAVELSKQEQRPANSVNEYRRKKGLEPLKVDATLMRVARHAAPRFNHVVDGKWCWERAHQAGFSGWASDDIANGYITPEEAVDGWATSDGHARQMRGYFKMNGQWSNYKFNRLGVGISGRKYIAVFGRQDEMEVRSPES